MFGGYGRLELQYGLTVVAVTIINRNKKANLMSVMMLALKENFIF